MNGSPWKVAACRAVATAFVVGALAFLTLWATTDELKPLLIGSLTPALTVLATRLGVEGTIDSRKPPAE